MFVVLPGQYYDSETGLHYNYHRTYDPDTGRYIESDPIGLAGGINTYAYGYNNPVINYDPYGLNVFTGLGGLLGESIDLASGGEFDWCSVGGAFADGYNGEGDGFLWALGEDILAFGTGIVGGSIARAAYLARFGLVTKAIPSKAIDTLAYIQKTGKAPPGYKGGRIFKNQGRRGEQRLPQKDSSSNPITYREYDINPYQKGVNRGAERIVRGSDGRAYYTNNHYRTFTPIK